MERHVSRDRFCERVGDSLPGDRFCERVGDSSPGDRFCERVGDSHPVIDFVNAQVMALPLFNKTKYDKTQENNYYFYMKSFLIKSSFCWS